MSDYVQIVNYASKDLLASGNPLKAVRGTELNAEFASLASVSPTKENKANKGIAGGYAGLDNNALVPLVNIPTPATNTIPYASLAQLGANTLVGNNLGVSGNAAGLTPAQVLAMLNIQASNVGGLAPSATTDTTNASNITSGTLALAQYNASATFNGGLTAGNGQNATVPMKYVTTGSTCTIYCVTATQITVTTANLAMTMSGLPPAVRPAAANLMLPCVITVFSAPVMGYAQFQSSSTLSFAYITNSSGVAGVFPAANNGIPQGFSITYPLV